MAKFNNLNETATYPDPFVRFDSWYKEHLAAGAGTPGTVYLGTASSDGHISVRTVLLKDYGNRGFVFFTNYSSRKSLQISQNPNAAMLFYWPESGRQVRVEGSVKKIVSAESDTYFSSRPRESQISAWASDQSSIIPDRKYLEDRFEKFRKEFEGRPVARPPHWGGYRLVPDLLEFWTDGKFRLHDRIVYTKSNGRWKTVRLAP